MYRLIDVLESPDGSLLPELTASKELIVKVIKEEEDAFLRTLDKGIGMLENHIEQARKQGLTKISGKDAFVLYDTFGFPLDLTELILRENGMTVDIEEFNAEMEQQKNRARGAGRQGSGRLGGGESRHRGVRRL